MRPYLEARVFKLANQFVDVLPEETFEESGIDSLIAALHGLDEKKAIRLQDFQDFFGDPLDIEGVIERIRIDDVHRFGANCKSWKSP